MSSSTNPFESPQTRAIAPRESAKPLPPSPRLRVVALAASSTASLIGIAICLVALVARVTGSMTDSSLYTLKNWVIGATAVVAVLAVVALLASRVHGRSRRSATNDQRSEQQSRR